jgi:hypothetical protein
VKVVLLLNYYQNGFHNYYAYEVLGYLLKSKGMELKWKEKCLNLVEVRNGFVEVEKEYVL